MLHGCNVVVVEGPSDQIYFSAMKIYLIANGKLKPRRELLFLPAGGVEECERCRCRRYGEG